jgi:hypothetical protein
LFSFLTLRCLSGLSELSCIAANSCSVPASGANGGAQCQSGSECDITCTGATTKTGAARSVPALRASACVSERVRCTANPAAPLTVSHPVPVVLWQCLFQASIAGLDRAPGQTSSSLCAVSARTVSWLDRLSSASVRLRVLCVVRCSPSSLLACLPISFHSAKCTVPAPPSNGQGSQCNSGDTCSVICNGGFAPSSASR